MDIQNTDSKLHAKQKKIIEVSLVRKGARRGCHITAYQEDGKQVVFRSNDAWAAFDLS